VVSTAGTGKSGALHPTPTAFTGSTLAQAAICGHRTCTRNGGDSVVTAGRTRVIELIVGSAIRAVLVLFLGYVCSAGTAEAQEALPAAVQLRLATYFAPVFLFHPDEQFYPTDIFTPFRDLTQPTAEDAAALAINRRVRAYLSMSLAQRLDFATVYYRVWRLPSAGARGRAAGGEEQRRVAIQYFFYYLFNDYRARGGVIPAAFAIRHFHDFENLVIEVAWPSPNIDDTWDPAAARVVGVYGNAHGSDVPDNLWHPRGDEQVHLPLHVIVELGSHALAPDINENGRFDPSVDVNPPMKFVWGIRDHGATWARYKAGYMDVRAPGHAVELAGRNGLPEGDGTAEVTSTYALTAASVATDGTALIWQLAGAKGFGHASWTVRLFGDTDPRTVVHVPAPPVDPEAGRGDAAAAAWDRGLSVGVSNLMGVISFYGGGRWLFVAPRRFPDLLVDGQVAVNNDRRAFYTVDSLASWRLDFITRLLLGAGAVAPGSDVHAARLDLLGGVEFRLGHLRVRTLARHNSPMHRTWADLRVTYVF
jgi:hypothetical protein